MLFTNIWLRFLVAALVTWRVTHLLALEDGPGNILVYLRRLLGQGFLSKLMDCFNCLSLWVAAPVALIVTRNSYEWVWACLSLSGVACLMERTERNPVVIQPLDEGGLKQ